MSLLLIPRIGTAVSCRAFITAVCFVPGAAVIDRPEGGWLAGCPSDAGRSLQEAVVGILLSLSLMNFGSSWWVLRSVQVSYCWVTDNPETQWRTTLLCYFHWLHTWTLQIVLGYLWEQLGRPGGRQGFRLELGLARGRHGLQRTGRTGTAEAFSPHS